jgi:hypothetical protein
MARKEIFGLYGKLDRLGIAFKEMGFRKIGYPLVDEEAFSCYGLLQEKDGTELTAMRLQTVMELAAASHVYVVATEGLDAVMGNGLFVCFIETGVLAAFKESVKAVTARLQQCFSFLQEEEEALELDATIARFRDAIAAYERTACDIHFWVANSRAFQQFLQSEYEKETNLKDVSAYMEDSVHQTHAEKLRAAIICLNLIG